MDTGRRRDPAKDTEIDGLVGIFRVRPSWPAHQGCCLARKCLDSAGFVKAARLAPFDYLSRWDHKQLLSVFSARSSVLPLCQGQRVSEALPRLVCQRAWDQVAIMQSLFVRLERVPETTAMCRRPGTSQLRPDHSVPRHRNYLDTGNNKGAFLKLTKCSCHGW